MTALSQLKPGQAFHLVVGGPVFKRWPGGYMPVAGGPVTPSGPDTPVIVYVPKGRNS